MTILRWIMLTALLVAFLLLSVANWTPVPFRLPDGAIISIRLPLLLGLAFVAGWLPTWPYCLGVMANFKRKAARTGRIADSQPGASKLPSQAQPTIVPPAGA